MPINTPHPTVEAAIPMWDKCEAFIEGEDAVKSEGTEYLPKLSGQDEPSYDAYKDRAVFFAAASKTCAGLLGAVFYKRPEVNLPDSIASLEKVATKDGKNLSDLAVYLVKELLTTGRAGLLVEKPVDGSLAPYLVPYDADDVWNWGKDEAGEFVVLEEDYWRRSDSDRYVLEEAEQYRELVRTPSGQYVVNVHREVKDPRNSYKSEWKIVETYEPMHNGRPLEFVPFVTITPDGLTYDISKPPLYDLVSVNLQHYRLSADMANALHKSCFPNVWLAGDLDNDKGELVFELGSDSAWVLPAGTQVGFIEMTGKSLDKVEGMLDRLENMSVSLGARMVSQSKISTGVETAKGSEIRENQATEILSSILIAVEAGLERALKYAAVWANANPDEVSVKLNKDFVKSNVDANMLNAMVNALQNGALSPESFYKILNEADFYAADSTFEAERASIEKYMKTQEAPATTDVNSQTLDKQP